MKYNLYKVLVLILLLGIFPACHDQNAKHRTPMDGQNHEKVVGAKEVSNMSRNNSNYANNLDVVEYGLIEELQDILVETSSRIASTDGSFTHVRHKGEEVQFMRRTNSGSLIKEYMILSSRVNGLLSFKVNSKSIDNIEFTEAFPQMPPTGRKCSIASIAIEPPSPTNSDER